VLTHFACLLEVGSSTAHVAWKACNEHVTEIEIYALHVVLLFMLEESAEPDVFPLSPLEN